MTGGDLGETGTIPAWAGKPRAGPGSFFGHGDHPRVGGGTSSPEMPNRAMAGPSPRGRGNLVSARDFNPKTGTIPAWAGEPRTRYLARRAPRDHPRVGGGTRRFLSLLPYSTGPSPRGRGNHLGQEQQFIYWGTIPAWAGEPTFRRATMSPFRDHPRVGGGTHAGICRCRHTWGPSPRGRGNHFREN